MKPSAFRYVAPRSLEELFATLDDLGDEAKILAGGQSLGPLLNLRLAVPEVVIDLRLIPGLDGESLDGDGALVLGAMRTQRQLERSSVVADGWPVLRAAVRQVAHPTIRNRGTIGGSLAHADPAAELPAVAVLLGARMTLVSSSGTRTVAAHDFVRSYFSTALEPNELLREVVLPRPSPGLGQSWVEFAPRRGDFAVVGVGATVEIDGSRRLGAVRLVVAGVAETPLLVPEEVTRLGRGTSVDRIDEWFDDAVADWCEALPLVADATATVAYRRRLLRDLLRTAVDRAAGSEVQA